MSKKAQNKKKHQKNTKKKSLKRPSGRSGTSGTDLNRSKDRSVTAKKDSLITTTISLSSRGVGYADHPDTSDTIEIPEEDINTALHKDTVEITFDGSKNKDGKLQGKVKKVLERNKTIFVGTLPKDLGKCVLDDNDTKF